MKSLLVPAAVIAVILTACGKEPTPPVKPTTQPSSQSAPAPAPGAMSEEDKVKAMEAAKAAAKAGPKNE